MMVEKKKSRAGGRRIREELLAEGGVVHGGSSRERELAAMTEELAALDEDIASARAASRRGLGGWDHRRQTPAAALEGEHVILRQGSEVLVRPIQPGDTLQLEATLEHLSAVSRFRRFRAPIYYYTSDELEWLTHVDHRTHEALVALDPSAGTIIGMVRYVCDPKARAQAHVSYVVADLWQGRGLGRALIERLAASAISAGVERFTARMLVGDQTARRLLEHVAYPEDEQRDGDIVEITARLRASAPRA